MATALAEDELLAEVRLPLLARRTPNSVSTNSAAAPAISPWRAALVTYRLQGGKIADARVGVGGAEPFPRRIAQAEAALNGQAPGDKVFRAAAEAAANAIEPLEDHQTSGRIPARSGARGGAPRAGAERMIPKNGHRFSDKITRKKTHERTPGPA